MPFRHLFTRLWVTGRILKDVSVLTCNCVHMLLSISLVVSSSSKETWSLETSYVNNKTVEFIQSFHAVFQFFQRIVSNHENIVQISELQCRFQLAMSCLKIFIKFPHEERSICRGSRTCHCSLHGLSIILYIKSGYFSVWVQSVCKCYPQITYCSTYYHLCIRKTCNHWYHSPRVGYWYI